MSFRNFLDLRKKTQQQTQIIERIVFQRRSLKSDLFLALSVILVASFIVWGVSKADDSVFSVIPVEAGIQSEISSTIPDVATVIEAIIQTPDSSVILDLIENPSSSVIPVEAGIQSENVDPGLRSEEPSKDPRIREDDTINTNNTTNEGGTTNIPLVLAPEATSSDSLQPILLTNLTDIAKEAVDEIIDIVTATSTYTSSTTAPLITSEDTDTGKLVTITAIDENPFFPLTDVLASTTIPKLYKVGEESKIKIKWKNENNQEMPFQAKDTDNDNYLDLIEWTVPHLSTQTFEIIFISKAFLLDQDQNIIADIYDIVKTQDGNYASLTDGQYVRTTFEQVLDNTKDVTLYAKATNIESSATIEVYPVYTDENGNKIEGSLIATFNDVIDENTYKILLTNLEIPTDTFDLKIIGNVDVDYIVDPVFSCQSNATGTWSAVGTWTNCNGTVPQITDTVEIMSGHTVTIDVTTAVTVSGLLIDASSTLVMSNGNNTTKKLNVTGDVHIYSGGNLTHTTNPAGNTEVHKLNLSIDGNLTVDSGGTINVDGLGYVRGYGPGTTSGDSGGAYGGLGFGGVSGPTYGSITAPVNYGSGGSLYWGTSGGGSIILNISGTTTINGIISANGSATGTQYPDCGSGGSVYLTTGTIADGGVVRANGGNSVNRRSGGGGRVAIILTGNGADFSNFSGNMTAYGGLGGFGNGAAGTVYKETGTQYTFRNGSNRYGDLTINNNNISTVTGVYTSISSLVTDTTVGNVILTTGKAGKITIDSGQTLNIQSTSTSLTIGTGTTLINNGTLNFAGSGFTNTGTWTNGTGSTVALTGTNQTISGSNTFYNLTKSVTSADTLTFTASTTQTIASGGKLTLNGVSGQLLTLQSSTSSPYTIAFASTSKYVVDYVNVSRSTITGLNILALNSTNGSNNVGWTFQTTTGTLRYWVATSSGNWNSTANWSTVSGGGGGASVPVSTSDAIFDGNRNGDCNIDAVVNVKGVIISGYSGTIVQGSNAITIGADNFTQSSGIFTGSGTGSGITVNGSYILGGGVFVSTSGTFAVSVDFTKYNGIFTHNNGTVAFGWFGLGVITTGGTTFNNVIFGFPYYHNKIVVDDMDINGNLTISGPVKASSTKNIYLAGNFYQDTNTTFGYNTSPGTAFNLIMDGNTTQTLTQTAGKLNTNIVIANNTAVVKLNSHILSSFFKPTITINASSTFDCSPDGGITSYTLSPSSNFVNNGTFYARGSNLSFTTLTNIGLFNGGQGSITIGDPAVRGDVLLSNGSFIAPSGYLNISGNLTKSGGIFNHSGGTINFYDTWASNVTSGGIVYNNVIFSNAYFAPRTLIDDMDINGNLIHGTGDTTGLVNASGTRTIHLAGNITSIANPRVFGGSGTLNIILDGASDQTINFPNVTYFQSNLTITKPSGSVILGSIFKVNNKTTTINTSNTLNLAGFDFTSASGFVNNGTLKLKGTETVTTPTLNSGSTVEYTGTTYSGNIKNWTYTNSTLNINGLGGVFTLPSAKTFASLNVLAGTFNPSTYLATISGAFNVYDTIKVNSSTFAGNYSKNPTLNSTSTVNYSASGDQTISATPSYANLTISGSGTKSLSGTTNVLGNLNILAGILDASANNYNLNLGGTWTNSVGISGFNARAGTLALSTTTSYLVGSTTFNKINGPAIVAELPIGNTVGENNTVIAINNGNIVTNSSIGTVDTNNLIITNNNGNVNTNTFNGTISNNLGNLINPNQGIITANNSTLTTNGSTGIVGINNSTINTNNGTTTINGQEGIINTNNGSVISNLGYISINEGIADTNTFVVGGYNGVDGVITGDAIFAYPELVATEGSVIDQTGYANGIVGGVSKDSLGNAILTWVFNITDNIGKVTGDAMFNGTTTNRGVVTGNAIFGESSVNSGTVLGNVDMYYPAIRPLGGSVNGVKTYHGYPDFYFNDKVDGHGVVGKWDDPLNWWVDSTSTIPAGDVPGAGDIVHVYSDIATTTAPASVASVTFEGGSVNHISINVSGNVTFFATSTNDTDGIINSSNTVTFMENLTDNFGSVFGTLIRLFTEPATTTRNFASSTNPSAGEGGRSDWIIIAQGVVVNLWDGITGATYDLATNIFKALNGGLFFANPNINGGAHVVPVITITSPIEGDGIKWMPLIDWDTSTVCEYSYNNFATTTIVDCSNGGSDIPRPISRDINGDLISYTLYLRGTVNGSITETSGLTFTYDNTVPVYTSCGLDLLDEATRPYYYLSENITNNCFFTTDTELRGSPATNTPSFTLTGNVISHATSTNAYNIILKDIIITGTTTATTTASGKDGGNITVENSIVGALISNGTEGTAGGIAGNITVATSTTGMIIANGGNGTSQGSNGGTIEVWNSDGMLAGTLVESVGGSATICGTGGEGGDIEILNSNNYTAISDSGIDQTEAGTGKCPSPISPSSYTKKTPIVVPRPIPPSASTNTNNTNSGTNSVRRALFTQGTINTITLPIQQLKPIKLPSLPTFGADTKGSFSFSVPIKNFLFSPISSPVASLLKSSPKLENYITKTLNLNSFSSLFPLLKTPLKLNEDSSNIPGIFKLTSPKNNQLSTSLKVDKQGNLSQYIKVDTKDNYKTLNLSLSTVSSTTIEGKLSNTKYTFINSKDNITTTLNIPKKSGLYTFTTSASPLPLTIEVVSNQEKVESVNTGTKSWWGKVKGWFGL